MSLGDPTSNVITIIRFATALMETLKKINKDALQDFKLRIGIAVGPVIAGVVGAAKPQYDIWVFETIYNLFQMKTLSFFRVTQSM